MTSAQSTSRYALCDAANEALLNHSPNSRCRAGRHWHPDSIRTSNPVDISSPRALGNNGRPSHKPCASATWVSPRGGLNGSHHVRHRIPGSTHPPSIGESAASSTDKRSRCSHGSGGASAASGSTTASRLTSDCIDHIRHRIICDLHSGRRHTPLTAAPGGPVVTTHENGVVGRKTAGAPIHAFAAQPPPRVVAWRD